MTTTRRLHIIHANAIYAPFLITVVFWLWSKTRVGGWDVSIWQGTSQILALLVLTSFSILMVIAARNRAVEKLYGGLDKSYKTHGILAKWAIIGMILHPLLLIPVLVGRGIPWYGALVPIGPWPEGYEMARWFGVISFYMFLVLTAMTLWRKIGYQQWLFTHKFMGLAFLFAAIHTYMAASDVKAFEPLRTWVTIMVVAGLSAWVYKSLFYHWAAQQYRYVVDEVNNMGKGIVEIVLSPVRERMNYEPGEFGFISVRGNPEIPAELHPFSFSSSPDRYRLRFSIREAGDYTSKLKHLKKGDPVVVYGPYGEFSSYVLDEFKDQVWIAGGIGVTPFLSMLGHERDEDSHKKITLFYAGNNKSDLVYDPEIEELSVQTSSWLRYVPWLSEKEGFLTADAIEKIVGNLDDKAFLFCGPPPMMAALKKQLMAKGVPANKIFFEEFNFV
ncbi:MAG: ferric reductase-like transmembrane domain-containing protein [Fimbriimonadaceae bacterium]